MKDVADEEHQNSSSVERRRQPLLPTHHGPPPGHGGAQGVKVVLPLVLLVELCSLLLGEG